MNIVTIENGMAVTTSMAIADGVGNTHATVIRLVRDYADDLSEFGPIGFEIQKGKALPQGGFARSTEYAIINEPQATLLLTYMRNNEVVRDFKKKLVKAFYELSANQKKPRRKAQVDPLILQSRQAAAVLSSHMRAAKLLGTDIPMARAIAVEAVRDTTGLDYGKLLANNTVDEVPVTPTELGKSLDLSAIATNRLLVEQGMQFKNDEGAWEATKKGEQFCTLNPYKSKNSEHTGYTLKWYPKVLQELNMEKAA